MKSAKLIVSDQDAVYLPASKWYQSGSIQIDKQLANEYNDLLLDCKLADESRITWDTKTEKNGKIIRKNPIAQHHAGYINIDKIASGIFNAHPDENVFRFHSTITNTKKELRNAITIDNKEVAAVDLSNSQPTLLTILLNPDFLTGGIGNNFNHTSIPNFNLKSAIPNKSKFDHLITLTKKVQSNGDGGSEFEEYRELVKTGQFYNAFKDRVEMKIGNILSIKEIKGVFFTVLFTDNRFIGQKEAATKRVFRDWFPILYEQTSLIKSNDSANLPILLQRLESYIMFHKIIARITKERPDLPIIPIHDSIATIKGEDGYIEQVMCEELELCLGFKPHFKKEYWQKSILKTEIDNMKK